jgi:hypothetical protein
MSTTVEKLDLLTFDSEEHMLDELSNMFPSIETLEEFLGVEFALKNGKFPSDIEGDDDNVTYDVVIDDVDLNNRRQTDCYCVGFPKSYPAHLIIAEISYSSCSNNIYARWTDDIYS